MINSNQTPEGKKAEEIFETQNPQDGKCPEWAIKLAQEYSRQSSRELLEALEEAYNEKVGNVSALKYNAADRATIYKSLIQKHKEG